MSSLPSQDDVTRIAREVFPGAQIGQNPGGNWQAVYALKIVLGVAADLAVSAHEVDSMMLDKRRYIRCVATGLAARSEGLWICHDAAELRAYFEARRTVVVARAMDILRACGQTEDCR